jgi:hypothetical protein
VIRLLGRAAAALGGLAHLVESGFGLVTAALPVRVPWALVVAAVLALGAWNTLAATRAAEARLPSPQPASLRQALGGDVVGWMALQAVASPPYFDSSAYGGPVLRFYHLLTDPADPEVALVARSIDRLDQRRMRTIVVDVTVDATRVTEALAGLGDAGAETDRDRYLVEVPNARPASLARSAISDPGDLPDAPRGVTLQGTFGASRRIDCAIGDVACRDGAAWEYLVSGARGSVVVRSPHPPDALPVDVWGVLTTDPLRVQQALDVPAMREAVGDRRTSETQVLADGVGPPVEDVSYVPAAIMAIAAGFLILSWLVGYPVFSRARLPERVAVPRLPTGRGIDLEVDGTLRRSGRRAEVHGAPATLERLAGDELVRRTWQYAADDRAPGEMVAEMAPLAGGAGRLALHSAYGPLLVTLDPAPPGTTMQVGELHRISASRPAVRLRSQGLDLTLSFPTRLQLARALAAISPEHRLPGVAEEPEPMAAPQASRGAPRILSAASARVAWPAFAVLGIVITGSGLLNIARASVADDPSGASIPAGLTLIVIGGGLIILARGLFRRRDWARSVGLNVAWVGGAMALFLATASPRCGLWLAPNLASCEAAGGVGVAAALVSAALLAVAGWELSRSGDRYRR